MKNSTEQEMNEFTCKYHWVCTYFSITFCSKLSIRWKTKIMKNQIRKLRIYLNMIIKKSNDYDNTNINEIIRKKILF